jgi:hypothetical protein
MAYASLKLACAAAGLRPLKPFLVPQKRRVGRPLGARDSRPRWGSPEALDAHAALMRERFGAVEKYEKELNG